MWTVSSDTTEEKYQEVMRQRRINQVLAVFRQTGISKEDAREAWKMYMETIEAWNEALVWSHLEKFFRK